MIRNNMIRHWTWEFVIEWTSRMAQKHGSTVRDISGKTWDWGQALAREVYGEDWMNNAEFRKEDDKPSSEAMDIEIIECAKRWEAGKIPEWCVK